VSLGLIILILADFQVHYGLYTEWQNLGGLHQVPQSAKNAWLAFVVIFWVLFVAGMALLPRQMKQEAEAKPKQDQLPLHESHKTPVDSSDS